MDKIDSEDKRRVPGLAERVTRLALTGSLLLTACGRSLDLMPEIASADQEANTWILDAHDSLITPTANESNGDYIAYTEELKGQEGLWSVQVPVEGGSVLGAIDTIAGLEGSIGYAATVISPDKSRVIQFTGSSGGGKNALEVTAVLSEDGAFDAKPELAAVDMRTIPAGTEVVVGTTDIVNQNLESLLGVGGVLSDVNEYWKVEWMSGDDGQGNLMQWYTVTRFSRESGQDQWIRTPFVQFNRDATLLGPWTPVGE